MPAARSSARVVPAPSAGSPFAASRSWLSRAWLFAILGFTALLRLRLLTVPLERDEGEYAYMGQLILHGDVPYLAAHNMKLPGVYYANAFFLGLLGETGVAIRLGLLALNLTTIVLVFALARRLAGATAALVAAATYALLSVSSGVLGFTANAEHFVVLPLVAALLLLVGLDEKASRARVVGAGLLLGLGYVMKQHGAAFVGFGLLWTTAAARGRGEAWRSAMADAIAFVLAASAPFLAVCALMFRDGAFSAFWFWTVTYAREYATLIPLAQGIARLREQLAWVGGSMTALWALVLVGATALAWDDIGRRHAPFLLLLLVVSLAAVCPGLRFSEHYFILCLPVAALLAGLVGRAGTPGIALAAGAFAAALVQERALLFEHGAIGVSRAIYGTNPFPEAVEIGHWLARRTTPDERIGVIGSEPEIYFHARRRAATSYIYMYPLMEPQPFSRRMQEEMIAQLEAARPRYLVLVNVDTSWSRRPDSSTLVFEWAARTVSEGYRQVAVADIVRDGPTTYRWDTDAAKPPRSPSHVVVFERTS